MYVQMLSQNEKSSKQQLYFKITPLGSSF